MLKFLDFDDERNMKYFYLVEFFEFWFGFGNNRERERERDKSFKRIKWFSDC